MNKIIFLLLLAPVVIAKEYPTETEITEFAANAKVDWVLQFYDSTDCSGTTTKTSFAGPNGGTIAYNVSTRRGSGICFNYPKHAGMDGAMKTDSYLFGKADICGPDMVWTYTKYSSYGCSGTGIMYSTKGRTRSQYLKDSGMDFQFCNSERGYVEPDGKWKYTKYGQCVNTCQGSMIPGAPYGKNAEAKKYLITCNYTAITEPAATNAEESHATTTSTSIGITVILLLLTVLSV